MKIELDPAQIAYLKSIGVWEQRPAAISIDAQNVPCSPTLPPKKSEIRQTAAVDCDDNSVWPAVVGAVIALLVLAGISWGSEAPVSKPVSATSIQKYVANDTQSKTLAPSVSVWVMWLRNISPVGVEAIELSTFLLRQLSIEGTDYLQSWNEVSRVRAGQGLTSGTGRADHAERHLQPAINQPEHWKPGRHDAIGFLATYWAQRRTTRNRDCAVLLTCSASVAMLVLGFFITNLRRNMAQNQRSASEAAAALGKQAASSHSSHFRAVPAYRSIVESNHNPQPDESSIAQLPVSAESIPLPQHRVQQLTELAVSQDRFRIKPRVARELWSAGGATGIGQRQSNEDYHICFAVGDVTVGIVADGCGGLRYGARAAYLASVAAAKSVMRAYGTAPEWQMLAASVVAMQAMADAGNGLRQEGRRLAIQDVNGGLRTTLIVTIVTPHEVGFAAIGDGGAWLVNPAGDVRSLFVPQKGHQLNVLTASLGPITEGIPVGGSAPRSAEELLILTTDGIADRLSSAAEFAKAMLSQAIELQGDLQALAYQTVTELASQEDTHGVICDDNLTLVLIGPKCFSQPRLSHVSNEPT